MASQVGVELPSEYDTLNLGIGLYDPQDGTLLDANERLEAILGYTTEELRTLSVGVYSANTYPQSGSEFRSYLQASASGERTQFTWRLKRADGELIWGQFELLGQTVGGRTCVRAEVRDVTDYYETHHRAELFWRMLRHNLRNEATIIAGNAELVDMAAEDESVRDATATIHDRVERLSSMADSVTEIEQAVAQTETQRVRQRAATTVREVADGISDEYPAAEITVIERDEMWIDVEGSLTHALAEALENAIVHSTDESPTVDVRIGPSPNTGRAEIAISDTNPAIPDDEFAALFIPGETTSTSHGSGVGLFVMKWCIESLGGEIEVERRDPRGNVIRFFLPPKAAPSDE